MSILIRYDVDGWAFYRRARALQRVAPRDWRVDICSDRDFNPDKEIEKWQQYRAVLLCSMTQQWPFGETRVVRLVGSHAWLYGEVDTADWRTKGVNQWRCRKLAAEPLGGCNAVGVYNREQQAGLREFNPNTELMPYCVDKQMFREKRRRGPAGRLRIGWCGQLGGGSNSFKGLVEVLLPVVAKVGELVVWRVNPGDHRYGLRAEQLVDWYNGIDLFLCTSVAEGGPQPPFEAAACGCAVLSTDVGQVADWRDLRDMGMIVPGYRNEAEANRTAEAIAGKIEALDRNRRRLKELQMETRASIDRHYDAAKVYPGHLDFIAGGA